MKFFYELIKMYRDKCTERVEVFPSRKLSNFLFMNDLKVQSLSHPSLPKLQNAHTEWQKFFQKETVGDLHWIHMFKDSMVWINLLYLPDEVMLISMIKQYYINLSWICLPECCFTKQSAISNAFATLRM